MPRVAGQRRQRDEQGAELRARVAALGRSPGQVVPGPLVDAEAIQRYIDSVPADAPPGTLAAFAESLRQPSVLIQSEGPTREELMSQLMDAAAEVSKPRHAWELIVLALEWYEEFIADDVVGLAFACLAALEAREEVDEPEPEPEPVIEGLADAGDDLVPVRITGAAARAILQTMPPIGHVSVAEPEPEAPAPRRPVKKAAPFVRAPRGRVDLSAVSDDNPFTNGAIPGVQMAGPLKRNPPRKASGHQIPVERQQWKRDGSGRRVPIEQED